MGKFLRFFNKNSDKIIRILAISIFVILILQVMDKIYKDKNNNIEEEIIEDNVDTKIKYTVVNNKKIEENEVNNIKDILYKFIEYCNNKDITNAYSYLTEECKNALYNTESDFKNNYIDYNFSTYKEISMQAWSENNGMITYIVRFSEDMLSSGIVGDIIEEYYTFIKQQDGTYKININNYIFGEKINKSSSKEGITVQWIQKDTYKDYEEYKFQIINNTTNTIFLENYIENLYAKDNNSIKYSIIDEKTIKKDILLNPNGKRNFSIKFNKKYSSNYITSIVLNNLIMNYYEQGDKVKIDIEI